MKGYEAGGLPRLFTAAQRRAWLTAWKQNGGFRPRMRDSQRSKLYEAEPRAFRGTDADRDLPDLAACQAWVDAITRTRWFRHAFPVLDGAGVDVRPQGHGRSASAAMAKRNGILLGSRARKPWVMLHELAHCCVWFSPQHHGRDFARAYLYLVRQVLGRDMEARLRAEFVAGKVKHRGTDAEHWLRLRAREARAQDRAAAGGA